MTAGVDTVRLAVKSSKCGFLDTGRMEQGMSGWRAALPGATLMLLRAEKQGWYAALQVNCGRVLGLEGTLVRPCLALEALRVLGPHVAPYLGCEPLPVESWALTRLDIAADLTSDDVGSLLADLRRCTVLRKGQELTPYRDGMFSVRTRKRVVSRAYIRTRDGNGGTVRVEAQLCPRQIQALCGSREGVSALAGLSEAKMVSTPGLLTRYCHQFDPECAIAVGLPLSVVSTFDRLCAGNGPVMAGSVPPRVLRSARDHSLGWARGHHSEVIALHVSCQEAHSW